MGSKTRALLLGVSLASVSARALAQTPSEKARAEALFQEGKQLFDGGNVPLACRRFEESQRLEAKLGTLLNLAVCHEKEGRTASAWAEFTEAGSIAQKKGETDRAEFAREQARALEQRLSYITVNIGEDLPGLLITVNGRPLGGAGTKLPIDPGEHRMEAKAPGYEPWEKAIVVPPGPAALIVEVPRLNAAKPAEPPPPARTPPEEDGETKTRKPKPDADAGPTVHPAAWVCFGIGGAGLLVGAITGGVSLSQTNALKDECPNGRCSDDRADDLSSANTLANVSNVTIGIGVAAAAAGLIVVLVSLTDTPADRPVAFEPVGDVGAGLRVRF